MAVFRAKVKALHPDQGAKAKVDMAELVRLKDAALRYVEARAGVHGSVST